MGDSEIISAEVPNIQSLFKQGRKQEAWAIIEDIAMQGVPFPRLDEIKKEFFSDSKKWKWGQWGPDDDLVGRATVSVENSFLKNAEMLMGTKGLQMGRHLAAMAAKVQGALYSAAMDENTRPLCQALDDLQCDYPSPEFFKYSPPQHCFCNCIWIYIDKEEEGYEADKDWDKLVIDKTGSSPGELIDKHGHANSWYEQNDRKDVKDILVSYRVLEKAGKNLFGKIKDRAEKELNQSGKSGMMIMGDLQFFGAKDPRDQIREYIARQEAQKVGEDRRIKYYTKENVDKAQFFYDKNLKKGLVAPDGDTINITEKDFQKAITDFKILLRPELIKEIILNAEVKVRQQNGRNAYYSYKPAGYVVTGDITYSVHSFEAGDAKKVYKKIEKDIISGGKLLWEKD